MPLFIQDLLSESSANLLIGNDIIDKMVLCHSRCCHAKRLEKSGLLTHELVHVIGSGEFVVMEVV